MNKINEEIILKIPKLPDLEQPKYTSIYGKEIRNIVLERQNDFFYILIELAKEFKVKFSLRYTYSPDKSEFNKIGIYLIIKSDNPSDNLKIREIITSSFVSEFYSFNNFNPDSEDPFFYNLDWVQTIVEGAKKEIQTSVSKQIEESKKSDIPFIPFYYHINNFEPKTGNDMSFLLKNLYKFDKRMVVDISFNFTQLYSYIYILKKEYINRIINEENILPQVLEPLRSYFENKNKTEIIFLTRNEIRNFLKDLGLGTLIIESLEKISFTTDFAEKPSFESLLSLLSYFESKLSSDNKNLLFNNNDREKIEDYNLNNSKNKLNDLYKSYLNQDLFIYSIKVLSEEEFYAKSILSSLFMSCTKEDTFRSLVYSKNNPEDEDCFKNIISCYKNAEISRKVFWSDFWIRFEEEYQKYTSLENSGMTDKNIKYTTKYLRLIKNIFRMHKLATSNELKSFFRFVIPGIETLKGIPFETDNEKEITYEDFNQDYLYLGYEEKRDSRFIGVPLQQLNKHMFICGVPGSGKTTAVINLLTQLWCERVEIKEIVDGKEVVSRKERQIPFLVIEPAKTEYRTMKFINSNADELEKEFKSLYDKFSLNFDNENIHINIEKFLKKAFLPPITLFITNKINLELCKNKKDFFIELAKTINEYTEPLRRDLQILTLGKEDILPLRFNPFEIMKTDSNSIGLDEHISNLEQAFKSCIDLGEGGPLPALLSEAIEEIYIDKGWVGNKKSDTFPTMEDLYLKLKDIIELKSYDKEIKGNFLTALEVRIGSLLRRSMGKMFNTEKMSPSFYELMRKPVVIELDALNSYQANLVTMFLLMFVKEYVKITRDSGSKLSHVIVIEEAHNIIGNESGKNDGIDTKAEATKIVVRMLAEMRALGQGFIIADQLPTAVSDSAIKNTNIKISHRIVSADDRATLYNVMLMEENDVDNIARFRPGQALVYQEDFFKAISIIEPNIKSIFGIYESLSDNELLTPLLKYESVKELKDKITNDDKKSIESAKNEIKKLFAQQEKKFKDAESKWGTKDSEKLTNMNRYFENEETPKKIQDDFKILKSSLKHKGIFHIILDEDIKIPVEALDKPKEYYGKFYNLTEEEQKKSKYDKLKLDMDYFCDSLFNDLFDKYGYDGYFKDKETFELKNTFPIYIEKFILGIFHAEFGDNSRLKNYFVPVENIIKAIHTFIDEIITKLQEWFPSQGLSNYCNEFKNKAIINSNSLDVVSKLFDLSSYENKNFLEKLQRLLESIEIHCERYLEMLCSFVDLIFSTYEKTFSSDKERVKHIKNFKNILNKLPEKFIFLDAKYSDFYIIKKFFEYDTKYYIIDDKNNFSVEDLIKKLLLEIEV